MSKTDCRYFNGYKPCGRSVNCNDHCNQYDKLQNNILVVHLEAMGAVLRATSLLPAIKRKFPSCQITWVTKKPSNLFFENNPFVDRVLTTSAEDMLKLKSMSFDFGFCIDKSLEAIGLMNTVNVDHIYGFKTTKYGGIVPANKEAEYLWSLGLNNNKKFYENKKPETQLMCEAFCLTPFKRDSYQVFLSDTEMALSLNRKKLWQGNFDVIVGINTGCAPTIAYKKLSIEYQRNLIQKIQEKFNAQIVLLGGPDDTERNQKIADGLSVICSETQKGVRDGLVSLQACDIVVSGDSLGMHMGIALKKWVIAWFGPTCDHEIDLYDRGVKLKSKALCSPCWKRSCQKQTMCFDLVDENEFIKAISAGIQWLKKNSLNKTHTLEMTC